MTWWAMILIMIALQVWIMPFVGAASLSHVYFAVAQGWMGAAMGAAMAGVGGLLQQGHHPLAGWEWATIVAIFVIAVAGYRYQFLVDDREWLHDMIPHHSMALTTSRPRLASQDHRVARLAQEIIMTQEREIATMKAMAQPYSLAGWRLTWVS